MHVPTITCLLLRTWAGNLYTSHVHYAVGTLPFANNAMHSPSIHIYIYNGRCTYRNSNSTTTQNDIGRDGDTYDHALQLHYRQFLVALLFADLPSLHPYPPSFHEMIFILVLQIFLSQANLERQGAPKMLHMYACALVQTVPLLSRPRQWHIFEESAGRL